MALINPNDTERILASDGFRWEDGNQIVFNVLSKIPRKWIELFWCDPGQFALPSMPRHVHLTLDDDFPCLCPLSFHKEKDMLKGGENINKWLWPWSDGSKGWQVLGKHWSKYPSWTRPGVQLAGTVSSPTSVPGASWLHVGDRESSIWLPFRQVEWTSLEKCKRDDGRLGWSHRKSADQICLWLEAGRASWKTGWHNQDSKRSRQEGTMNWN